MVGAQAQVVGRAKTEPIIILPVIPIYRIETACSRVSCETAWAAIAEAVSYLQSPASCSTLKSRYLLLGKKEQEFLHIHEQNDKYQHDNFFYI
jgi:hypothetical protein